MDFFDTFLSFLYPGLIAKKWEYINIENGKNIEDGY